MPTPTQPSIQIEAPAESARMEAAAVPAAPDRTLPPEVEARQVAALGLARQGFAIAQCYGVRLDGRCSCGKDNCIAPGKHGGQGWLEQATTDPDAIRTRFLRGEPNYGVVPPAGSGLLIVDEDQPGSLDTLGALPATLTVRTGTKGDGSRGRHVYGRLPASINEAEVPYQWAGGEVRVHGNGHVVGPYSRHRSGVTYEPLNGSKVAELPEAWVRALIASGRDKKTAQQTARDEADPGWKITQGRHDYLKDQGVKMRRAGVEPDALFDQLTVLDRRRCDPPLSDTRGRGPDELRAIVEWVGRKIDDNPPSLIRFDEPEPSRRREVLTATTWADLMAEPATQPPVIRPGVPEVGVTVLAGSPKGGKTLWAGQVAIESKRSTLLVIEEGSRSAIAYRLRKQAEALGIESPPITVMHRQRIRLEDRDSLAKLRDHLDETQPALVIFDPLNRLHSADENKPSAMTPVMDALAELAYDGHRAVIAIHHVNKPSQERRGDPWDRMRGASSIRSGTDANLILDGDRGTYRKLLGEFRDAEPLIEHLDLDRDALLFRPAEEPTAPSKVDPMALRAFVEERGQVTGRQVVERFGVSKTTALYALRALGCDEWPGSRGVLTFALGTVQ